MAVLTVIALVVFGVACYASGHLVAATPGPAVTSDPLRGSATPLGIGTDTLANPIGTDGYPVEPAPRRAVSAIGNVSVVAPAPSPGVPEVSPWVALGVRLIPRIDPLPAVPDLIEAITERIDIALAELASPPPVSIPAPPTRAAVQSAPATEPA